MIVVFDGRQVRRSGALMAVLVWAAACGEGHRTVIDSPLDARKVAPAVRTPPSDAGIDVLHPTSAPPGTDAASLAGDGAGALAPSESSGTVELRLVLPAGRTYCDQRSPCDPQSHIWIQDLAGRPVTVALPYCPIPCDSFCAPPPCPVIACVPMGNAFTGEQRIWDGQVHAVSTCGMNTTCYRTRYVPRGRYVAVMCATPGQLMGGDAGAPTCQATGARQCIEVPFEFPSATAVVGHLP